MSRKIEPSPFSTIHLLNLAGKRYGKVVYLQGHPFPVKRKTSEKKLKITKTTHAVFTTLTYHEIQRIKRQPKELLVALSLMVMFPLISFFIRGILLPPDAVSTGLLIALVLAFMLTLPSISQEKICLSLLRSLPIKMSSFLISRGLVLTVPNLLAVTVISSFLLISSNKYSGTVIISTLILLGISTFILTAISICIGASSANFKTGSPLFRGKLLFVIISLLLFTSIEYGLAGGNRWAIILGLIWLGIWGIFLRKASRHLARVDL